MPVFFFHFVDHMNVLWKKGSNEATPKHAPWRDLSAEGMVRVTEPPKKDPNAQKITDIKAATNLNKSNIVDVLSKLRKLMNQIHVDFPPNSHDTDSRDSDEDDVHYDTDSVAASADTDSAEFARTANADSAEDPPTHPDSQQAVSHSHSASHAFSSHLLEFILAQAKKGHVTSSQMTHWMTGITWGLTHGTISQAAFEDFKEKLAQLHTAPASGQTHNKQDPNACCWFG